MVKILINDAGVGILIYEDVMKIRTCDVGEKILIKILTQDAVVNIYAYDTGVKILTLV